MHTTSTLTTDGPYLHVLLPDVLPPDWQDLRHELEPELDEGVTHVTFVLGRCAGVEPDDEELRALVGSLRATGVEAVVHG